MPTWPNNRESLSLQVLRFWRRRRQQFVERDIRLGVFTCSRTESDKQTIQYSPWSPTRQITKESKHLSPLSKSVPPPQYGVPRVYPGKALGVFRLLSEACRKAVKVTPHSCVSFFFQSCCPHSFANPLMGFGGSKPLKAIVKFLYHVFFS